MARLSIKPPWWRRMLARWWAIESACCLWARPMVTQCAYECGWCGRRLGFDEWSEPVKQERLRVTLDLLNRTVEAT